MIYLQYNLLFHLPNIYQTKWINSEESCKMMHYAGLSDKLSAVGLFEYGQSLDENFQTAQLLAQMIWYFIEGYVN